jgi:ATP-dependent Zn protease
LKNIPNSSFVGGTPISTNQVDNLQKCIASCSSLSNCSGATFNNQQNICSLISGEGSIVPSGNSGNIAIVSENLYYLNQIKQLNQQLLDLNNQIRTSIQEGKPIYNETIKELQISSNNLKNNYSQLEKERKRVNKMIQEFENLETDQKETSITSSGQYTLFLFYLILTIIVIFFLIFIFSMSNTTSNSYNNYNNNNLF